MNFSRSIVLQREFQLIKDNPELINQCRQEEIRPNCVRERSHSKILKNRRYKAGCPKRPAINALRGTCPVIALTSVQCSQFIFQPLRMFTDNMAIVRRRVIVMFRQGHRSGKHRRWSIRPPPTCPKTRQLYQSIERVRIQVRQDVFQRNSSPYPLGSLHV
jgi:hypothetical protein